MNTYHVIIGGVERDLPIVEVKPGVRVAVFSPLGDWEVNEAAGKELARKLPTRIEALVMPDGKAQALLHVLGRETGLPTGVFRKELKPYMTGAVSVEFTSITTGKPQTLYVSGTDVAKLVGKRVAVVDDVVSTGSTLDAMNTLLVQIGATPVATLAVFTEGPEIRKDVISLGHLPLF